MAKNSQGRIFWGLLLIILGVLFLFDQMGRIDFGDLISRYWPALFIIIGISILIDKGFRNSGSGLFFILIGTFMLLMRMEILNHRLWHYFWPMIIIAAGIWIIFKPAVGPSKKKILEISGDDLGISVVFSGLKRRIESPQFKGGKAEVVFGSLDLDLTGAGLAGGQAALELSSVFGEIVVRVPRDWQVVLKGSPVLGAIEDKRPRSTVIEWKNNLQVNASAVFGSVDIKD